MPLIPLHMFWSYVRKNVGGENRKAIVSEERFGLVDIQNLLLDAKRCHRHGLWKYYVVNIV